MGEEIYEIDGDLCTECVGHFDTPQCVEVCPVDCCLPDPDRVETDEVLLAKIKDQESQSPTVSFLVRTNKVLYSLFLKYSP